MSDTAIVETEERTAELDEQGRAYATGRRKESTARVWIKKGKGDITINGREFSKYFARPVYRLIIGQVFTATKTEGDVDVVCTVKGGGLTGQAGAILHGIARALDKYNPSLHSVLRKAGFLTRDSRAVERKKPGRPKARKSFQFSKR